MTLFNSKLLRVSRMRHFSPISNPPVLAQVDLVRRRKVLKNHLFSSHSVVRSIQDRHLSRETYQFCRLVLSPFF